MEETSHEPEKSLLVIDSATTIDSTQVEIKEALNLAAVDESLDLVRLVGEKLFEVNGLEIGYWDVLALVWDCSGSGLRHFQRFEVKLNNSWDIMGFEVYGRQIV